MHIWKNSGMEFGLLLIRLAIGSIVAIHGAQKLFGWFGGAGITGTARFMESVGFRPGRRYAKVGGVAELGGGLLLVAGLLTPLGAMLVVAMMLAAIVVVRLDKGFPNANGGYEFTLVLVLAAAGLAYTGPGYAALDGAIGWDVAGGDWGSLALIGGIVGAGLGLAARANAASRPSRRRGPRPTAVPAPRT